METVDPNKLLADWRRFIRNGFRYEDFSDAIFDYLMTVGGFVDTAYNYVDSTARQKAMFWSQYLDEGLGWLWSFIEMFGGSLDAVMGFDDEWIGLAPDLNRRIIEEMRLIYPALENVLAEQRDMLYDAYKAFNLHEMELADGGWTAEQRAAASEGYDLDFYYYGGQELFDYDGVDDDLRDRLAAAVAAYVSPNAVATLFETARPAGTPAPSAAQETLFTTRRVRRRDHRRLAEATSHRHSAPVPAAVSITPAAVAQYQAMRGG